jgi:hypothetical protein
MSDDNNNTPAEVVNLRPVDQISMDFIRGEDEESLRREAERKSKNASIIKDSNVEPLHDEVLTPAMMVDRLDWARAKSLLGVVFDENDKPIILLSSMAPKELAYASMVLQKIVDQYMFGE